MAVSTLTAFAALLSVSPTPAVATDAGGAGSPRDEVVLVLDATQESLQWQASISGRLADSLVVLWLDFDRIGRAGGSRLVLPLPDGDELVLPSEAQAQRGQVGDAGRRMGVHRTLTGPATTMSGVRGSIRLAQDARATSGAIRLRDGRAYELVGSGASPGDRAVVAVVQLDPVALSRAGQQSDPIEGTLGNEHDRSGEEPPVTPDPTEAVDDLIKRVKWVAFGITRFLSHQVRVMLDAGFSIGAGPSRG